LTIRQFDNSTIEEWNVEALAEIPLRREKNGKMEKFENSTIRQWKNGKDSK